MNTESDRKTISLTQKRLLVGGQKIELSADGEIRIHMWGRGGSTEVTFPIAEIDPNPSYVRQRSWFSLFATGFLLLMTCFAGFGVVTVWSSGDPSFDIKPVIGTFAVCVCLTILSFRDYQFKKVDIVLFHGSHDGQYAIWRTLPSLKASEAFREELVERIREAREAQKGSYNETLANEVRGLAKLRADGLISEEEFRKAKTRLLGLETGLPNLSPPSFEAGMN